MDLILHIWKSVSECVVGPFENPPSSRQEQRTPYKNDDHMTETKQDDIDMLIDEELSMWPKAGWVTWLSHCTVEKKLYI